MVTMTGATAQRDRATAAADALRDEFSFLRRPLLLFLATLASAVLLVGVSDWIRSARAQELESVRARHDQALARLQSAEKELQEIRTYQPRFLQMQAAGLVGVENRLAWIETIDRSQQMRKLLSVSYEIEPQQWVSLSAPMAMGEYQLRASRMMLRAGLLHEMDLFNLLDDLNHAGLYTVQDCRMRRTEVPAEAGLSPRITADCTLVWVTLGPPPAPPVAATPTAPVGTP
ncbi:hypothetical protein [Pseudoduganella sp. GCM10020061]|uniref:hypothetical protein n=1 Tax=Pseudoduganella sp. GCM10020061 TaxID=3317345 RepID=UPI0036280D0A